MWTDEETGTLSFCGVFAAFSHYVASILMSNEPCSIEAVFEYVERCMKYNEDISTAAATCFLENIMNRTPEQIYPSRFVPLLGTESRYYCRAWDEFCGVRTEGLW